MAGYLVAQEGSLAGLIISFNEGLQWILGQDPCQATILLADPFVSKKHVLCHLTSKGFALKNLSSENPAILNGKILTEQVLLKEGDILQIGTTLFRFTEKKPTVLEKKKIAPSTKWLLKALVRQASQKSTTFAPNVFLTKEPTFSQKSWKDFVIPKKYLACVGVFSLVLLGVATADLSLARNSSQNKAMDESTVSRVKTSSGVLQEMTPYKKTSDQQLEEICTKFPEIQFSFEKAKGKLFLTGKLQTTAQKQALYYALSALPFIKSTEDTVVIDEIAWRNALETKIQTFSPHLSFSEKVGQRLNNWGQRFVRPIDYSVENCTLTFTSKSRSHLQKIATSVMHAFAFTYTIVLYEIGDAIDRTGDFFKTKPYNYLAGKAQEKSPFAQNSFSLLSANLCMLPYGVWAYHGISPPNLRIDGLVKKILQTDSDFVCLQEISASHANTLWRKIQKHYAHGFSRIGPMPLHRMNNGLFFASKYPIEQTLYHSLPNKGAIDRGVFCVKTKLGWILVGHLKAGKAESDMLVRKEQVASIQQLCKYLSANGTIPCLIAMDSNIPRVGGSNDEYTLSEIPQHFTNGLYPGNFFSLTPEKATCTNIFSLALQGKNSKSIEDAYEHIDYVLSYKPSSHLISLTTSQIPTYSESNTPPLSDHKILVSKIKLSKQFMRQTQDSSQKK